MRKAIFLDRDGVLNQDPPHYAHRLDQLAVIPGADDAVKLLREHGYLLIVITNQSGVARGYYPEEQVGVFNEALMKEIRKKGGDIDAIYYCPHHPEAPLERYRVECACRKPKPGMILEAARTFDIDLDRSFLVGDKATDIQAGKNAGCRTILVLSGQGADEISKIPPGDCLIASDLYDAAIRIILGAKTGIADFALDPDQSKVKAEDRRTRSPTGLHRSYRR